MTRFRLAFGALVITHAAHATEEYVGRLWETFPPARFLTGLVSPDRELGFIALNLSLLAFGLWGWLWPMRRGWRSAVPIAWVLVVLETINGVGHVLWTMRQGGYTPGVATAPVILVIAYHLARQARTVTSGALATA